MRKWEFYDPETDELYVHEINPNTMSSPFRTQNSTPLIGNLAYRRRSQPKDWDFGGVIRTQGQYDNLLAWSQRSGFIYITDHNRRAFKCFLVEFRPDEKRPNATKPWRFDYTMRALVLEYLGVSA